MKVPSSARSGRRRALRLAAVAALAVAAAALAVAAAEPVPAAHAHSVAAMGEVRQCAIHSGGTTASIRFTSPDGLYKIDDTIGIDITVSRPIENDDTNKHIAGTHTRIKLETGTEDRFAESTSHSSNRRVIHYQYTVQAGDESGDLDYHSRDAWYTTVDHLAANSAPFTYDSLTNPDSLYINCRLPSPGPGTAGSLSNQSDIRVDGIAPRVSNVTVDPSDGYGYGETVEFDVNFGETVVYSGAAPVLRLSLGGGETRSAGYASGNNTNRLTFSYLVQSGDDSADADYDGTMALTTAGSLTDLAGNTANLTLSASGSIGRTVPVRLGDIVGPSVLSVSSTSANGTHGAGSYVNVTVLFNEVVQVTGTPLLELATGVGASRNITYASGNGTTTLAFDYTVAQGDRAADLDYTSAAALRLDGGTIRDEAGNDADLVLPEPGEEGSLGHSADILVKTAGPFVRFAASPDTNETYRTGQIVAVTLNFTDPVAVAGEPRLKLGTDPIRYALYRGGSGTDALEFWYTVQPGDTAAVLDYNDTASLVVPDGGSISAVQGGAAVDMDLWRPGAPGSLSASRSISIAGAPGAVLSPAAPAPAGAYGLIGPYGVDVFEAGNKTFALVGEEDGDGLQLVRIRDGNTLERSGSMENVWRFGIPLLDAVKNVHAFEMNGTMHALAASWNDYGIQLVRINGSGAGTMSPGGGVTYWSTSRPDARSVYDADTFEMDNKTFGILTVHPFNNVNLINILPNGTLVKNSTVGAGPGFGELYGPRGIDAFELNGTAHAVVALSSGNGVHLIRIHPDGRLQGIYRAGDGAAFPELNGARGIDVFEMDNKTYAIVAASGDDGVQLIRIHTNGTLEGVSWATDGAAFPELGGASHVDTFKLGGAAYAVVTAYDDDGVQLIRIHPDGTLEGIGSATDGPRFPELNGARGIAAFELGGVAYAAAVAYSDGLQMIRLSPTLATNVSASSADDTCGVGCHVNVTVEFDGTVRVLGSAPSLSLLLDGRAVSAPYLVGNNTDALVFNYTVRPGDLAVGGIGYAGATPLTTRGSITGIEGADAYLALPAHGKPGSLAAKDPLVVDTRPAEALSVSSPLQNGTYPAYYRIPITVAFDKPVDVLGPPPSLLLAFDGGNRTADYVSGNGTRLLEFAYTVQPGDSAAALEYARTTALAAGSPGGRIVDAAWAPGADAGLSLPEPGEVGSLGHMRGIGIDASTAAYPRNVTSPNADGAYGPGRHVDIDVRFTVPVDVAGVPRLALATDPPQDATYLEGTGTNVLTFRYTVQPGDGASDLDYAGTRLSLGGGASVRDQSDGTDAIVVLPVPGAEGSLGHSKNITIDTRAPSVEGIASPSADGAYATGRIVDIAVSFDETVYAEGAPALRLATDPPRNATYASGSGTTELTFAYAVQPGDRAADLDYAGRNALSLGAAGGAAIRDAAGNAANRTLPAPGPDGPLAGRSDIAVIGAALPVIAAAAPAAADTLLDFAGARHSAVVEAEGRTYAVATSYSPSAALLVRVHENGTLEAAHKIEDTNAATHRLAGAVGVDAFGIGNRTFAVVAALNDNGVQLLEVHPGNESLTLVDNVAGDGSNSNTLELFGALGVDAFGIGNRTFVIAAALWDSGVQLLEVHPGNDTLRPADQITDGSGLRLTGASDVAAFEIGNRTYAAVAARDGNGVQVVRIHGNGTLEASPDHQIADTGSLALAAPLAIEAVEIGGSPYAIVAARGGDNGVQAVRIRDDGTPEASPDHRLVDTGGLRLANPQGIAAFEMGGQTFAAVAATDDDGVQLVRFRDDGAPLPAGSAAAADFPAFGDAYGTAVFAMANRTYAMVTSSDGTSGDDIQLIRLSPASVENASASLRDGEYGAGQSINITVGFDAPVSVADPPPSLLLDLGGREGAAGYLDGSGTSRLVFNYTVRPGDNAGGGLEYAGAGALVTRGLVEDAGARGSGGSVSADLELPAPGEGGSLGHGRGITIDTPPAVESVFSPDEGGAYAAGSKINVTVAFTEAVDVTGTPLLWLSTDPPRSAAYVEDSDGDAEIEFRYTVGDGDAADRLGHANSSALVLNGGDIRDSDGTAGRADLGLPRPDGQGLLGATAGIRIDTAAPRVASVTDADPREAPYREGDTIRIAVAFDERVVLSSGADLSLRLALGGGEDATARYERQSDRGRTLVFSHAVDAGDSADPLAYGQGEDALSLVAGTAQDAAGNNAELGLPPADSPYALRASGITIDATGNGGNGGGETPGGNGGNGGGETPGGNGGNGGGETPGGNGGNGGGETPGGNGGNGGGETPGGNGGNGGGETPGGNGGNGGGETPGGNGGNGGGETPGGNGGNGGGETPGGNGGNGGGETPGGNGGGETPGGNGGGETPGGNGGNGGGETPGGNGGNGGGETPGGNGGNGGGETPGGNGGGETPGGNGGNGGGETPGGNGGNGGNGGGETPGGNATDPGANGNATDPGANGNATSPVFVVGSDRVDGQGNFTGRGDEARITIDVSGLPGAGTAGGAVRFPSGSATVVTTSFASVSFPPGVEATSVPADRRLVLHVVNASVDTDLPSNSSIRDALAYGGSGAVVLQRVVEIGDEDARISFDMPIRISLEGQAAGRAFYIDGGANGTIEPIDMACAADDTGRVHLQLGGMGECRIDSEGGDLVVYTYHLTRFGTVASERGTPPPVYHTCSLRLGAGTLAVDAMPGAHSKAARQDVANSGSQPFARVALDATPWYIDPSSPRPGPSAPSLPASLTVASEAGEDGAYSQLPAAVAQGLGGGLGEPLWLRINLTGHDQVNATRLVQHVEYTAECAGAPAPR